MDSDLIEVPTGVDLFDFSHIRNTKSQNCSEVEEAVSFFWQSRLKSSQIQSYKGAADQTNRSHVIGGKNLDGFVNIIKQTIKDSGIPEAYILVNHAGSLTLPGFYRPTKNWDLLVLAGDKLLAAIEFKSQVGPSFGNNFNNRVEEAIGNAVDLHAAYQAGMLGSVKPFVGYFFVLEDCTKSRAVVESHSVHFSTTGEFVKTSYAERYNILCRKLIQGGLYSAASLILTPQTAIDSGEYTSLSEITDVSRFITVLSLKMEEMARTLNV